MTPGWSAAADGRYSSRKRFFDGAAVEALFGPAWETLGVEERTIHRYSAPKVAWEVILRKKLPA